MEFIESFVASTNSLLWDALLLFLLCGTGIYFTLRLKFVQVTKFGAGMKKVFGGLNLFGKEADKDGMSSFQALATAVAAQIGTGNLAGAATAIVSGGPGAIFWMWLSAFFGMATIFAEATVAQKYKTKTAEGEITGGPAYYIKAAFNDNGFGKFLAVLFSLLIIFALGFMGNMVQSNSIGNAFQTAFGIPAWIVGLLLAVVAGFIFIGGIKRIASFTEKVVPFMAVIYIVGAVAVLCMNFNKIGYAFQQIFVCAFKPESLLGAALGVTVQKAMRFGVARGLFSNEAGMGSTPHAHAVAKVDHPCEQGVAAMIGVFIDTFVVLTLTALVVIISGLNAVGGEAQLKGIELTQAAFSQYFGTFGNVFIAVCLLFFAFSTVIGWYFFGEANVKSLFGAKYVKVYAAIVVIFIVVGSALKVDLVWNMSDMFNG
ncbi:MAG: alanine:cation symporter family protein, partial [Clostridia bacterium]|nr:alanine:cation symporter family protein [Clostridia bacterium]